MDKYREMRLAIDEMRRALASCMRRDRFPLNKQLRDLSADLEGKDAGKLLAQLRERVAASSQLRLRRQAHMPTVNLDEQLPIFARRDEIAAAISDHQVVVISGATGSGKSTQLPLIAMQAGLGIGGFIGHTQPRRIAARSVAHRIASQMKKPLGTAVGFKIRFDDKTNDESYVKLMTDGILLAESQSDRFLEQYEMIIIDEAHERSLNIDFLIGSLKRILSKRRDLKVIVTSATIDTARFVEHFRVGKSEPPVIEVEGRTYPVELRYQPMSDTSEQGKDDFLDHAVDSILQIAAEDPGDILVFLPTENDIRTVSRKLKGSVIGGRATDVLPLYARLSTDRQNLIFAPNPRRRIVLSTNVAESSVTVPGIRIVVDCGTARISRYAPKSKVQRLPIEAISQASASQRAGRCGRTGPGVCIRLYSEDDFESRPAYTTPEIRRTNLASVILQTLALRLGNIAEFPFIDPPHPDAIADGYRTLFEIGAIDDRRKLTRLGRWLARLPIDPRVGRMIHAANEEGCLDEILIIAAALETQDPRLRPAEKQQAADAQHEKFAHEKSDFMTYLKIWDFVQKLKQELSRGQFKRACQTNFLSVATIHQWQEIHRQLRQTVRQHGLKGSGRKDDYDSIHRSLLSGLLSGLAQLTDRHEYTGAGGIQFNLWPGSGVFASKPKWIVAAEIVETSRRYGRTVGTIDATWVERLAEHLVKRKYVDPHWSRKRQTVMAYENVTLFGLPIVNRRRVGFTRIDTEISRELFIESGLAAGEVTRDFGFYTFNQHLIEEIEGLSAKTRRRDWVFDSELICQFYRQRLPDSCLDTGSLGRALKEDCELDAQLRLSNDDLLPEPLEVMPEHYPEEVRVGTMTIPVQYRFEPGQTDDGATVQIPRDGLGQIDDVQAGWLIPGFNEARVTAMIKSLPKAIRRNLVPARETAEKVVQKLPHRGSFARAVATQLAALSGERITADMFDGSKIDQHLLVNMQVVDDDGTILAQGRSVSALREQLGTAEQEFIEVDDSEWNREGIQSWDWGALPAEISITRGSTQLRVYPAIIDQKDSVALKLADSRELADHWTRGGLTRLISKSLKKKLRQQVHWLPDLDRHSVCLTHLITSTELNNGLMDLIGKIGLVENKPIPRSEDEFMARTSSSIEPISIATQRVAKWLPPLATAVQAAHMQLEQLPHRFDETIQDIREQIDHLTPDQFLIATSWDWLQHYPRFFQAIAQRCEKRASADSTKEHAAIEQLRDYWQSYEQARVLHAANSIFNPELERLRWMIEEFRVSTFAQKLGTSITVSEKRLDKLIKKVQ